MKSLINSCDVMMKVDTEEFVSVMDDGIRKDKFSPYRVLEYLDQLHINGSKLHIGQFIVSLPPS